MKRIKAWLQSRIARLVIAALMPVAGFAFDAAVALAFMVASPPEALLAAL